MPKAETKDRGGWSQPQRAAPVPRGGGMTPRLIIGDDDGGGITLPSPRSFGGGGRFFHGDGRTRAQNGTANGTANGYESAFIREFGAPKVLSMSSLLAEREGSTRPFEENVWVRAGIKAFSGGFTRLGSCLFRGEPSDKTSTKLDQHPLLDLLKTPNARMTLRELWKAHVTNFKLDGESFWFLADGHGKPVAKPGLNRLSQMPAQIIPIRGNLVEDKDDDSGWPAFYRYKTRGGYSHTYPAASVVHFSDYDPDNPTRGLGDVAAVTREIELYFNAFRYMDAAVRNNGDPGGFIIFDQKIAFDELERRQDAADSEFSTENARRIKVLDNGAKWTPNPVKPSDMQYESLSAWCRDAILAAVGCPGPVVNVYENATYNNVETAHRELWTGPNGIIALDELTADVITNKLIPRLPAGMGGDDLHFVFDSSNIAVLKPDIQGAIVAAADIAAKGVGLPINETLEKMGVEVEGYETGDVPWVGTLTDMNEEPEEPLPEPEPPVEPPVEPEDKDDSEDQDDDERAARPTVERLIDSPKLRDRVERWFGRYQAAQLAHLRKLARQPRGAKVSENRDIFDETFNPANLTDAELDLLLLNQAEWAKSLDGATRVALRDIWGAGFKMAHAEVGAGFLLKTTDPAVLKAISLQRHKLVEGVTSRLSRKIKGILIENLSSVGKSAPLRDLIKEALPEMTESLASTFGTNDARAATIAQTETGIAENSARMEQYAASGVTHVRWESSDDDAVRETHIGVDGQVVRTGLPFTNGLRHPHDPLGPASEIINCRCGIRAETYEEIA